LRISSLRF